jgi:hypothetical protein
MDGMAKGIPERSLMTAILWSESPRNHAPGSPRTRAARHEKRACLTVKKASEARFRFSMDTSKDFEIPAERTAAYGNRNPAATAPRGMRAGIRILPKQVSVQDERRGRKLRFKKGTIQRSFRHTAKPWFDAALFLV